MHLKYIKIVILKILFIQGLCNFKFSFKSPRSLLQQNYPPPTMQPLTKIKLLPKLLLKPLTFFQNFDPTPPPPPTPQQPNLERRCMPWLPLHRCCSPFRFQISSSSCLGSFSTVSSILINFSLYFAIK